MKFEIKNRWTVEVIFSTEAATLRLAAEAAASAGANLEKADLRWANLIEANLIEANLIEANLEKADLRWANLEKANLEKANLRWANLIEANLEKANLRWADLRWANLEKANLPAPAQILLCMWGEVSAELCADLMVYDSTNHPDPAAFDKWANGESGCPYDNVKVPRAANFQERKEHWGKGKVCRPFDLMIRLFKEKEIKF